MLGRDKELEDLRTVINNPEIRAVIISGQHNIGKTRLVLEATKHCSSRTIIARDPRSMTVSDLLSLESSSSETIVIIEDPTLDKVENFINQTIASQKLKLLITLPTIKNYPIPYLRIDKRINLRSHLRGSSCSTFMSDMKVRIELTNQQKSIYYYPDVIVSCDSRDQDRFFLNYPCLIIEVLSPSTEVTDKREKLFNYRNLSSLQEYVLIYQDEVKVKVYRKNSQGNWFVQTYGKNDELNLDSVNLTVTMKEIYEDVFEI